MKTSYFFAVLIAAIAAQNASAATIAYVGFVEGVEATDWRSATTPKTMDIDGDNIYGSSLGATHWQVAAANQQTSGSSTFGWWHVSSTGSQHSPAAYVQIDHINNAPTKTSAGIVAAGTAAVITFEMTGQTADYENKIVRVGVMNDVLAPGEWADDYFKGLQIEQTVGGVSDSGVIPLRAGAPGDGVPEMYFFDLTGVNPGDRFAIRGLRNVGGTTPTAMGAYIGVVSWDIVAIPEPGAGFAILFGVAVTAGLLRRRARIS